MSLAFPQELCDAIIDECRRDIPTLLQCALTCRAWLPRSRFDIFSTAVLHTQVQASKFASTTRSSPDLAALVEVLAIAPREFRELTSLIDWTCIALASVLPRLRRFTVVHPVLSDIAHVGGSATISARTTCNNIARLSTISELELINVSFRQFLDFGSILEALPRLSRLLCKDVWWKEVGTIPSTSVLNKRGWLNLEVLSLAGNWDYLNGVSHLVSATNPLSVKHLIVDAAAGASDYFDECLDTFGSFENLETLSFALIDPVAYTRDFVGYTVARMLETVKTSRLKRIRLDYTRVNRCPRYEVVDAAGYASGCLASGLLENARGQVRVEAIVADCAESATWWKAELENALSELHARGVLSVVVCDPWVHLLESLDEALVIGEFFLRLTSLDSILRPAVMDTYTGDESLSLNAHRAKYFEKQSKAQATKIIDLEAKVAYLEAQLEHLQGRSVLVRGRVKETFEPSRDDVLTGSKRPASPEPPLFENRLPSSTFNAGNPKKKAKSSLQEWGLSASYAAEGSAHVPAVQSRAADSHSAQMLHLKMEERMAGLPWFPAPHLSQPLQDMVIKRKDLNKQPLSISAQRRFCRGNSGRSCIFVDAIHSPHSPTRIGEPGLLFSASDGPQWQTGSQSIFAALQKGSKAPSKGTHYVYVGEYQLCHALPLSVEEYRSLPGQTKEVHAIPILSGAKGFENLRARLIPESRQAKKPDPKGKGKAGPTAACAVQQAFEQGDERINVWLMKCIGFDKAFLMQIYDMKSNQATGKGASKEGSSTKTSRSGEKKKNKSKKEKKIP
ncbi:hypothetical protein ACG7TL_001834 [Trametes sanguinea]